MSNVVFILGAGASVDCGAPLMKDFLDTASDLYKLNKVSAAKKDFENVFKAIASLQMVHSKAQLDINNIESVFTALEVARILNKLPGFQPSEIEEIIISLKNVIVTTLEESIIYFLQGENVIAPRHYDKLCRLVKFMTKEANPRQSVSIITFNYDIAMDVALYIEDIEYNYSLEEENTKKGLNLLKLHGSLNWATCQKCDKVIPWLIKDYFRKYQFHSIDKHQKVVIPIGNQLKNSIEHCSNKVNPTPVIIPPTWNKAEQHKTISCVWSKAAKELETAEYIFIIGYSLPETDAFFKLLFGLGTVGEVPLRKIVVFNPDLVVENRFREMLGPGTLSRFEFQPLKFDIAINYIRERWWK